MFSFGCLAVALLAAGAYVGTVVWFAHRERVQADVKVRKIDSLALASFGVEGVVKGWPGEIAGLAERLGTADRKALETRLKMLKGKTFSCDVPARPQWDPVKSDLRASRLPIPPESKVVDFADAPTALALQALHGSDHFLWILVTYSVEGAEHPVALVRMQAVVFGKDAKPVWLNVFAESESPLPGDPAAPSRDPVALEEALKKASARAIEHVAASLEGQ
ncbi:MAG: hypothetical protein HYY18_01440 [Planctomycetes bacterium]|nr:hypothetical protein [Planctomycetota bacterium]